MALDRCEAVQQFVEYLWDCRADGRWAALEGLLDLWRREARPEDFVRCGEQLADLAEHRRTAVVIRMWDRARL